MYAAKSLGGVEQWIKPPESALNRYLLRLRPRAANDNRCNLSGARPGAQIAACLALVVVLGAILSLV